MKSKFTKQEELLITELFDRLIWKDQVWNCFDRIISSMKDELSKRGDFDSSKIPNLGVWEYVHNTLVEHRKTTKNTKCTTVGEIFTESAFRMSLPGHTIHSLEQVAKMKKLNRNTKSKKSDSTKSKRFRPQFRERI